jgi:hypothetical protein
VASGRPTTRPCDQRAADQLADARKKQIDAWKQELTGELDQSIQEMLQLSRQQEAIEQKARQGADKQSLQGEQSALQQGVQQAGKRLGEAGQKSSLLSPRAQRSVSDAQKKVEQATRDLATARQSEQAAGSMREASEALNQAAASLVRDRERAQNASSASGFQEMLEQLKDMAQQQGSLNAQTAELIPAGCAARSAGREQARQQSPAARRRLVAGRDGRSGQDRASRGAGQGSAAARAGAGERCGGSERDRPAAAVVPPDIDAGRTLERDEREDSSARRRPRRATSCSSA